MAKKINARIATVQVLQRLLKQQGSLSSEFSYVTQPLEDQEKRFAQELCYGMCRWYFLLDDQLKAFLQKPLKEKDSDIKLILLMGLYQLQYTRVAPHAAINETVNTVLYFRKQWAKKLVNGVLRSFQRKQLELGDTDNKKAEDHQLTHPQWLQKAVRKSWPDHADNIFAANNQHPPFTLRVNQRQSSRDDYLAQLDLNSTSAKSTHYSSVGITLDSATDVTSLPGFNDGMISVQDEAAQLSAELLKLEANQRVLDACCAPGGKTCHIGETQAKLASLVAVDNEERRLGRVQENINRLSIAAEVICGDATEPKQWWDGKAFDRILLDAPCSATGVIRRHPDIKLLRTKASITELAVLQYKMLNALWPLLAEGGILLYATCSILPEENVQVVEKFINSRDDVEHDSIVANWGISQRYGRQLLPGLDEHANHDGFYYARLIKTSG